MFVTIRVLAPGYWTTPSYISFNFTGFEDTESTIYKYQWGIGKSPGAVDVLPLVDFTGTDYIIQQIKTPDGSPRPVRVFPAVRVTTAVEIGKHACCT